MSKKRKLITTENGTPFGEPIMQNGRRALKIKGGHRYDVLTPEKAAGLIAGVPVLKIIYQGYEPAEI